MFVVNRILPLVVFLLALGTIGLVVSRSSDSAEQSAATTNADAGVPDVEEVAAEFGGRDASDPNESIATPPPSTTTTTQRSYPALAKPGVEERIIGVATPSGTRDEVDAFAEAAGRRPNVLMRLVGWARDEFHPWFLEDAAEDDLLVILSWEPWDNEKESTIEQKRSEQPEFAVARILDGEYDEYIDSWAEGLAEWDRPVAMRLAHEMNGFWYPWSDGRNGNEDGDYVRLWRYVHERFERAGADNVIWVWSPNIDAPTLSPLEPLYPGDAYVDWIGLSGYFGHGSAVPTRYPSFDELFGPTIEQIRAFTDLPVIITETGATERGGLKVDFITDLLNDLVATEDVLGFVWFEIEKETDWRIVSSAEASKAFAAGLDDDRWDQPPSLSASSRKALADASELRMRQSRSFW